MPCGGARRRVTGIDSQRRGACAARRRFRLQIRSRQSSGSSICPSSMSASWGELRPDRLHRRPPSSADPDAGLRSAARLEPDGAMHPMVYPYGRNGAHMLQELQTDRHPSDDDACATRRDRGIAARTPVGAAAAARAPDFRQRAALADALLHPQDRAYSVPELFDFLDSRPDCGSAGGVRQAPLQPPLRCPGNHSPGVTVWHN